MSTNQPARRLPAFCHLLGCLAVSAALSCNVPLDGTEGPLIGRIAQPLVDSDSDGMDDGWETTHFGNLSQTAAGDFDSDGMTNLEEYSYGFNPTVIDAFEDADGDRYPNIHEIRNSSDPNLAASVPTPAYVVNGAGGGTHTTVHAALTSANGASNGYPIIGIAPGVYTGAQNASFSMSGQTKRPLIIGLQGAAATVIEGGSGWELYPSTVVASLTVQKATAGALRLMTSTSEYRFVDIVVKDSSSQFTAAAIHGFGARIYIIGSTLLNNVKPSVGGSHHIYISGGNLTVKNTVVFGQASGTNLLEEGPGTTTVTYSLVKGQTFAGTGNLAGSTDPKLRFDGRLRWDSPLRAAGGTVTQSRVDMDLETRPTSTPDIGADQFGDTDADDVADSWELLRTTNLTTLTSRTQDAESDGLTNEQEYALDTLPTVSDTDGDGLSDGDEVNIHLSNPLATDTDNDGMPDAWEVSNGLAPATPDGFEDADRDRFPNVYEYAYSTNPNDANSKPTPTVVVNGAGGGTHTNLATAITAANAESGTYRIIGVAPGVYTGAQNVNLTASSATKRLLLIGLDGAAKTIFDGSGGIGWALTNSVVVSSLTFRNMWAYALLFNAASAEARFVDLIVRDSVGRDSFGNWSAGGLHAGGTNSKIYVQNSTFLDNAGNTANAAHQIYIWAGAATLLNTVVWSKGSGTMLAKAAAATLTTNYCLVKGQTLTGTGNLAGSVDPKLTPDGHLRSNSPLRAAGGSAGASRADLDGEVRPSTTPDIGADQYIDSDADGLPDSWEIANAGNLTSIAGTADADSDGLSNAAEHTLGTNWLDPDTDHDGIQDGDEVTLGTNPGVSDTDDRSTDLNQDGVIDSIGVQLGYSLGQTDNDGDTISNADELLMCTNPLRADSDGDGVPDHSDAFPLDPLMSVLPSIPSDVTAPVITLTSPWYAVPQ